MDRARISAEVGEQSEDRADDDRNRQKLTLSILVFVLYNKTNENHDMAVAMSSSRADPVLGLSIPSSCPGWGYLNI